MNNHYTLINGQIRFGGNCEETRPFCGAICCKSTFILLTEEEKESGLYDYVGPTEGCNCRGCQLMRQKNAVSLRRNSNGCVFLDGRNECSLYEQRPTMCREFACEKTWWRLNLASTSKNVVNPLGNS